MKYSITVFALITISTSSLAARYILEVPEAKHKLYLTNDHTQADCIINDDSYIEVFDERDADNKIQWVSNKEEATEIIFISNGPTDIRYCKFLRGPKLDLTEEFEKDVRSNFPSPPSNEDGYSKYPIKNDYGYRVRYTLERSYDESANLSSPYLTKMLSDMAIEIFQETSNYCKDLFGEKSLALIDKIGSISLSRTSRSGNNYLSIDYQTTCLLEKLPLEISEQSFKKTKRKGFFPRRTVRQCQLDVVKDEEENEVSIKLYGAGKYALSRWTFDLEALKYKLVNENPSCLTGNCKHTLRSKYSAVEIAVTDYKVEFTSFEVRVYEKKGGALNILTFNYIDDRHEELKYKVNCSKRD